MKQINNIYGWLVLLLFALVVLSGCKANDEQDSSDPAGNSTNKKEELHTEQFMISYLLQDETGLIQTNLSGEDESTLYLAESLGLWMEYLEVKKDDVLFEQAFDTLQEHFLTDAQLVRWKVEDELALGSQTEVNALIDDLRIIEALFRHGENSGREDYIEQAKKMAAAIDTYQKKEGVYVDFYDGAHMYANDELTTSYVLLAVFEYMEQYGIISPEELGGWLQFARSIPLQNGVFPKSYNVLTETFSYDETVHMIDQLYVALHLEQSDVDTTPFYTWLTDVYTNEQILYGQYDAISKENEVNYQSASVYALAIMYAIERGEGALARELYESMIVLRVDDDSSPYVGGYVYTNEQGHAVTHAFDNLLPLLAERKLRDEHIIK